MKDKIIAIQKAEHVGDYKISLTFNDSKTQVVDFAPFLNRSKHPQIQKYKDPNKFKSFSISYGDLEWNDYEMCFPIANLYESKL